MNFAQSISLSDGRAAHSGDVWSNKRAGKQTRNPSDPGASVHPIHELMEQSKCVWILSHGVFEGLGGQEQSSPKSVIITQVIAVHVGEGGILISVRVIQSYIMTTTI